MLRSNRSPQPRKAANHEATTTRKITTANWPGCRSAHSCPRYTPAKRHRPSLVLGLVVIEAKRLAGMKPFLPGSFEPDDVIGVHIWRDSLEDGESEVLRITLPKQAIASVPTSRVV